MIDELIAGKRGEREILGQDGVLGELTRRMVERALQEELDDHLGYPRGSRRPEPGGTAVMAAPRRRCIPTTAPSGWTGRVIVRDF